VDCESAGPRGAELCDQQGGGGYVCRGESRPMYGRGIVLASERRPEMSVVVRRVEIVNGMARPGGADVSHGFCERLGRRVGADAIRDDAAERRCCHRRR